MTVAGSCAGGAPPENRRGVSQGAPQQAGAALDPATRTSLTTDPGDIGKGIHLDQLQLHDRRKSWPCHRQRGRLRLGVGVADPATVERLTDALTFARVAPGMDESGRQRTRAGDGAWHSVVGLEALTSEHWLAAKLAEASLDVLAQ